MDTTTLIYIITLIYIQTGLIFVIALAVVYIAYRLRSGTIDRWPHREVFANNALKDIPLHTEAKTLFAKQEWQACMAEQTYHVQELILEVLQERLSKAPESNKALPGSHPGV